MFANTLSVLLTYAGRQYLFIYTSLKHDNAPVDTPQKDLTPTVSILIPVHNEDKVIGRTLEYMCKLDYPQDKNRSYFAKP